MIIKIMKWNYSSWSVSSLCLGLVLSRIGKKSVNVGNDEQKVRNMCVYMEL